jgi:uncharacterized protein YjbI with pentapeptide repeats
MDYQLNIYPSNEKEFLNVKADNSTKEIKVLLDNKLPMLYKKSFGTAVKKYNERAISGKLIDNYYKSIVSSNIPEVYKLVLIVRYELLNKVEIAAIQKAFMDFNKALEKESYLAVASVYSMSYDEYKELQIFFYPISDGYSVGLTVKNDLIDVTKKLCEKKENINIAQAMPLFTGHIDKIFSTINNGQFISQEELEAQARNIKEENPMTLHAIAVETLKAQMNALQRITAENQQLEDAVNAEKARIQHDIDWSKQTELDIYQAEKDRIAEEKRIAEEARKAEAARRIAEAQRREEERLREEERRIEAERLAEQARRNIELRKQMAQQEEEMQRRRMLRKDVDQDAFAKLVEEHLKWQEIYNIDENAECGSLPEDAMKDPRRLSLYAADIHGVEFDRVISLIGASFDDCEFSECRISVELLASSVENCVFMNSELNDIYINKCVLSNLNMERLMIENVRLDDSTLIKLNAKEANIREMFSAPATSFIRCDFSDAILSGCDMKKNAFMNCNFTNTTFAACDLRDSAFQVCKMENIVKEGSLFRGVKINKD